MNKLSVNILRPAHGYDCTNSGASSQHDRMYLYVGNLKDVLADIEKNHIEANNCLFLVRRMLFGGNADYLVPVSLLRDDADLYKDEARMFRWSMMGGNFAYTSDSRWREYTGCRLPLPIHDRVED